MSPLFTLLFVIVACAIQPVAWAEKVYKVIDEDGNVTYTDAPPENSLDSQLVELPIINTQAPVIIKQKPTSPVNEEQQPVTYSSVTIASPAQDSTITPGQREVEVEIQIEPSLADGHRVQLILDGKAHGDPAPATVFLLDNLYRGSHTLSAGILDANGKIIARAKAITFHVRRTSAIRGNASPADAGRGNALPPTPQVPGVPNS